ncbi:MAG: nucleotidyltransferase domain-containing protein [Lentisphaerae bacterium]|nr:nucleotidyltransferase domain-containing protein [Lentisphaerota bacterium]
MMVTMRQIRNYARAVAREFRPEEIILFGSYAYGSPTVDSDVDLLVVMDETDNRVRQSVKIRQKLHASFPMDLLVRSPARIRERLQMGDSFIREILEKGKVLYEASDA